MIIEIKGVEYKKVTRNKNDLVSCENCDLCINTELGYWCKDKNMRCMDSTIYKLIDDTKRIECGKSYIIDGKPYVAIKGSCFKCCFAYEKGDLLKCKLENKCCNGNGIKLMRMKAGL